MKLQNRIALVTGAGKGIGKSIALLLAREGARVIVNYSSSEEKAAMVAKEIKTMGLSVLTIKADISSIDDIKKMVGKAVAEFGNIDILVNNAGVQLPSQIETTTELMWDSTIDTNLKGAFFCIQAVLPYMKKSGYGKIINISSMAAFVGSMISVPYGVSKAGIVNMTKTLSKELGKYHITINSVAPGPTNTDLLKSLGSEIFEKLRKETPMGRVAEPEDIARAVLFFASSDSDFITGQTLVVDGGRI